MHSGRALMFVHMLATLALDVTARMSRALLVSRASERCCACACRLCRRVRTKSATLVMMTMVRAALRKVSPFAIACEASCARVQAVTRVRPRVQ